MRAVVGQDGVHLVGHGLDQPLEEVGCGLAADALMQLDEGALAGAVDRHQHVELTLFGAHLGEVDVEVADRVGPEALLGGRLGRDRRQARDVVALEQAME